MYVKQLRPSLGFWGTGERAFTSVEQGNKGHTFRGTNTKLGNREHKKSNFEFLGTGKQANLLQGNKGTGIRCEGLTVGIYCRRKIGSSSCEVRGLL